jgi:hypothetical protein
MASGLDDRFRMHARVLRMQRDGVWNSATRRVEVVARPDRPSKSRISLDDVVVVVCFLSLIGIVVICGAVMLLSWVAVTLPVSARIACPKFDGCVSPSPDENQRVLVGEAGRGLAPVW